MSYPPKARNTLTCVWKKSINVNLNFYEQNIKFNKSGTFGMFSGLGLSWNNYRFSNAVMVTGDSASFQGYFMEGVSVRKSKLTNLYLTLPIFFEVQTKSAKNKEKNALCSRCCSGLARTHSH